MEEERNEMGIRAKEKLNKEYAEKAEETSLFQWLQNEVLQSKVSQNEVLDKKSRYQFIIGNLLEGKVTLSYNNTSQYVPQYVDGKDFLYIIRIVIDKFNQLENYRMVGALPLGEKGEIEIHIFVDISSAETKN